MEQSLMKAKSAHLGSRHPKVVLVYGKEENVEGVAEILSAHVEQYRTVALNKTTKSLLVDTKPSVLLIALESVAAAIEYYGGLMQEEVMEHIHYTVLLCNNKESSLAFRCCMKGLFDNYFVYQPLYEKFRLAMIVHNGLARTASSTLMDEFNEDNFEQIDEELAELIEQTSQCRQELLEKVGASREDIIQATQDATQKSTNAQSPNVNPSELMEQVSQDHVKPLLALLEQDIKNGLDSMLAQLLNVKQNAQAQAKRSKGLIHHQPSIRSKADKLNAVIDQANKNATQEAAEDISNTDQASSANQPQQGIANPPAAKEAMVKKRILVVEDNALYRDMLVSVLQKEQFDVEQAEDGLRALQMIREDDFDLIIMDLYMPKLDGLNTTKKIRQVSGGKEIPVIALTGNKNKEIIRKWASFGLKGYIIKPSTKDEILTSVGQAFAVEKQAES